MTGGPRHDRCPDRYRGPSGADGGGAGVSVAASDGSLKPVSGSASQAAVEKPVMLVNDPDALCRATLLGIGVALVAVPHAAPHLESGALERLLPGLACRRRADFALLHQPKAAPGQTRAFVDFISEAFRARKLAKILSVQSLSGATRPRCFSAASSTNNNAMTACTARPPARASIDEMWFRYS